MLRAAAGCSAARWTRRVLFQSALPLVATFALASPGCGVDESVSRGAVSAPTPLATPSAVPKTSGTSISSYTEYIDHEAHFPCGPFLGPGFDNYSRSFLHWTPDGSRLIFERNEQLWVIGQIGQGLKRLVDPNPSSPPRHEVYKFQDGLHADLSPDGQQIVYTSCAHPNDDPIPALDYDYRTPAWRERSYLNYELAVIDIDGGEPRRLTSDTRFDHFPAWSPDGSRIAFISAESDRQPIDYYELKIYMMSPSGGSVQDGDMSFGNVRSAPLAWSPDGEQLAYVTHSEDAEYTVYTVKTDLSFLSGTSQVDDVSSWSPADDVPTVKRDESTVPRSMVTKIGPSQILPSWSPDGEWLMVGSGYGGAHELTAVRADGRERREIVTVGSVGALAPVSEAAWAPDGSKIAFVSDGVWVVDSDGGNARKLFAAHSRNSGIHRKWEAVHIAWSPDSDKIAAYFAEAGLLMSIAIDGSEQQVLFVKDQSVDIQARQAVRPQAAATASAGP